MRKTGPVVFAVLASGVIMLVLIAGVPRSKGKIGNLKKIQTVGLPEYGIVIVGPAETAFTTLLSEQMHKTGGGDVGALASSSVFVVNRSGRSIAALSLKWEMLQPDGRTLVRSRGYEGGLQRVVSDGESAYLVELGGICSSILGNKRTAFVSPLERLRHGGVEITNESQ